MIVEMYVGVLTVILILDYLINFFIEFLNIKSAKPDIPNEFKGVYEPRKYRKAQMYLVDLTKLGLIEGGISSFLIILFIANKGLLLLESFVSLFFYGEIIKGLMFWLCVFILYQIIKLPFSYYRNFVIEERYGFNRMSRKTFFGDYIKSTFLGVIIGGAILFFILYFFSQRNIGGVIFCWMSVVIFDIFVTFISPILIMPLFYKFTPLKDNTLIQEVKEYIGNQGFEIKGIYQIDASRRSTKANAFFSGFGKSKRIAFFDTLLNSLSHEEIISVLAHEVGHWKKKHIIKHFLMRVLDTGIMLFLFYFLLMSERIINLLDIPSTTYILLFIFIILFRPINFMLGIFTNYFSRRYEYEADRYVIDTYGKPEAFISALKKLTLNNLSNLTPHPLKVIASYTHPPVLARINYIRKIFLK